jgi:hypothetical protein
MALHRTCARDPLMGISSDRIFPLPPLSLPECIAARFSLANRKSPRLRCRPLALKVASLILAECLRTLLPSAMAAAEWNNDSCKRTTLASRRMKSGLAQSHALDGCPAACMVLCFQPISDRDMSFSWDRGEAKFMTRECSHAGSNRGPLGY